MSCKKEEDLVNIFERCQRDKIILGNGSGLMVEEGNNKSRYYVYTN